MPPLKRAKPPLFGIRTNIPAQNSRLLSITSVVMVIGAWCLCSYVMVTRVDLSGVPQQVPLVSHYFLPAPHEVLQGLLYLSFETGLLTAILTSMMRIGEAFLLCIAVALPVGIAMGTFEAVNRFFDPILAPLRYLPITAFIPLMILYFGIHESQKIAFLFMGTVVFLLPVVVDAIRAVPEELVQTAFTLGASKRQVITSVLIPAAMPQIFDSFRVMNAIAWTYIILAEAVNPENGIGYIFKLAEQHNKPVWTFGGIIVVGVIGLGTDMLIRLLNGLLFRWRETDA